MDNTTGQSWMGEMGYSGPGSNAEWVVEDPGITSVACGSTDAQGDMGQCPMADYSPAVTFSYINVAPVPAPRTKTWDMFVLSDLSDMAPDRLVRDGGNDSFSVAYPG